MSDDRVTADAPTPIKLEQLSTVPVISTLGLIAARVLQQHGIVTLMVSADGTIELVGDDELILDAQQEANALKALIDRGYTDDQMEAYLRQRGVRDARRMRKTAL